jgi:MoCo/4Fe-4S cofactor protein with predicted Tat translocation signal
MNNESHKSKFEIGSRARPQFWRSLQELSDDDVVFASLRREFPEYADRLNDGPTRRQFLQLMGASLALAGIDGCVEQPQEKIVPYVRAPEQIVPGKPLYYATAMTHDGAGVGVLVESHMGRPVKVEGNPAHPAVPEIMRAANDAAGTQQMRFGATDVFSQASVLSLYDPDRSQTVLRGGQIDTWETFVSDLRAQLDVLKPEGGRGLRVLTETVVSPTLAAQLAQLREVFPNATWHQYEPINQDNGVKGNRLTFGADVDPQYHIARADVVVSLDADFLVDGPMHLQYAREFADRRRVGRDDGAAGNAAMNRLYVVESSVTPTGAAADHRLPLNPAAIAQFAARIAAALEPALGGADTADGNAVSEPPILQHWLQAVVSDLQAARGRCLVIAGRSQPPQVHAIAHWLNTQLGNVGQTVEYIVPVAARVDVQVDSLRELVESMRRGEVKALAILAGNPVYTAPAELQFASALKHVPLTVHLSQYVDETSSECLWHIPAVHLLESWSDTRAASGTVSIVQPLIAPLYNGKTSHELLNVILGNPPATSYEIVRAFWQQWQLASGRSDTFENAWKTALHDGVIAGTESSVQPMQVNNAAVREALGQLRSEAIRPVGKALDAVFRPDPSVWDGRFANNGWLQELPRPFTTLTWDNAALIGPQLAEAEQLETGDVVEVAIGDASVQIPVFVVPGHPRDTITLPVGYGRQRAGRVGNGVGTDVYPLRTSEAMWSASVTLRKTGQSRTLATTQHHHLMEGRHLVRAGTLTEFLADPAHPSFMAVEHSTSPTVSMYPEHPYDGYKWGMVVNQSACIGCNACVVACQAENNIPIVGRDQVSRGREMHWLRIDNYYEGPPEDPKTLHQPVMCMHCELAPCEPVCPVAATTHSNEGLNEMTYNRCVGTRYCSNNCPYKVRRFNFLEYNAKLRADPTMQLRPNPDVTVRSRGVMEKCTYCVQRINEARIASEKDGRTIRDGEVVTACQAACPTQALVFGNLNDENSEVTRSAASPLNYSLLGELNTRPRTTYLAVVGNPNPTLVALSESTPTDHAN